MAKLMRVLPRQINLIYPWKQWLDGRVWRITKGQDFRVPVESMRGIIWIAANHRKVRVKVRKRDARTLIIQAQRW